MSREGVQPLGPFALQYFLELALDHVFLGRLDGRAEVFLQFRDAFRVGVTPAGAFALELGKDPVHALHRLELRLDVGGADGSGALERHMLEHVGQPGAADFLVHGTRIDVRVKRHDGCLVAFHHDEMETVVEGKLGNAFLEGVEQLVRAGGHCQRQPQQQPGGKREGCSFCH